MSTQPMIHAVIVGIRLPDGEVKYFGVELLCYEPLWAARVWMDRELAPKYPSAMLWSITLTRPDLPLHKSGNTLGGSPLEQPVTVDMTSLGAS